MCATFRRAPVDRPASDNPERLFDDLPRTRDGVASLWAHQADVLRQYHESHVETADLALELPTGAGKTLPALLIAEWRRTALRTRVAYASPTVQLAHQVRAEAAKQGIDAVLLVGSHHQWDTSDSAKYEGSRAIAITTYSTIFNSRPALASPQALLLDDAHAGEQYVAAAWSVSVSRYDDSALYQAMLGAIRAELSGTYIQRLESRDPDPNTRIDVRLLPIGALRRSATNIDAVLGSLDGDIKFRYTMIRAALERCLLYVGWEGFLIRPYIAPTSQHAAFADASQRLYISATLGDGGELERAFGRAPIDRLPVPAGWDQRSSGRRFFMFPELVPGLDARSLARAVVAEAGKALVLAPSERRLRASRETVVPEGVPVFGKGDVEEFVDSFRRASSGVLALSNRYDGIDLADDSCRLTVLDGLPSGTHMQERFLTRSLRAARVLEERLRTRVVQGAGRSTRGLKDYSAVIVLGDDLTRFLQRAEVRDALRPETQAEILFGVTNSETSEQELRAAVRSFLAQDDDWQDEAEPYIAELRRDTHRRLPAGTAALAAAAGEEVKAWSQVWNGDYVAAAQTAVDVSQRLLNDGALSPYRALWLYFASSWQQAAAEDSGDAALGRSAAEILRKAHGAAKGGTWLREIAPLPADDPILDPVDEFAALAVAAHRGRTMSAAKWAQKQAETIAALEGTEAVRFEGALTTLGDILGADAFKPSGHGRADSVWLFGDLWWLTLEAKSETSAVGPLGMDAIRQTNTQLRSLAADRSADVPDGSKSVVVTPKQLAHPDAVAIADPHVCYCGPDDVRSLAVDTFEAWRRIRALATKVDATEALPMVREILADFRVLPSAIRERIAERHVAG